jgi:surfactin synthase thioesterase subunit
MPKVFFFPHAGGSASLYLSWSKFLSKEIEVKPVELAGRGKRMKDPLYDCLEDIVEDIYPRISAELEEAPYAFFGHSMGALLVYELVRKIQLLKNQQPLHIFFSGRIPPYVAWDQELDHSLSDEEFIKQVAGHGGISLEIFDNPELQDILLPRLRADYKAAGTYRHQGEIVKVNCDISIFNGKLDQYVSGRDLSLWPECTTGTCNFYEYDGGHFFINQYKKEISEIINNTLLHE